MQIEMTGGQRHRGLYNLLAKGEKATPLAQVQEPSALRLKVPPHCRRRDAKRPPASGNDDYVDSRRTIRRGTAKKYKPHAFFSPITSALSPPGVVWGGHGIKGGGGWRNQNPRAVNQNGFFKIFLI